MAGDIKIQRGTTDVGNTGGTDTSFTSVDSLTKAFALNLNSQFCTAGDNGSSSNLEADDISGRMELTGTGTLTFSRVSGSKSANMRFGWEIWEYLGDAGGDNEFIVRSRNTVTMATASDGTASLDTTPDDRNNCIPFITGVSSTVTSNGEDHLTCAAYLNSSGTLVVERGGGDGSGTTVVQVVVVEFTGSNWTVAHGRRTAITLDSGAVSIYADSTGWDAVGTVDIGDWGEAIIFGQHKITSNTETLADNACRWYAGGTTYQAGFAQHADASATKNYVVHVLQHDDMVVTRYSVSDSGPVTTTDDITSAGLTDLAESAILGSATTSGTGDAMGRGWRNFALDSLFQASSWCHRTGNGMTHEFQVIDLTGIISISATITPKGNLLHVGK